MVGIENEIEVQRQPLRVGGQDHDSNKVRY